MSGRFVIEGTWYAYTRAQDRIVHREVHPASSKKLRAWVEKTPAITYTDGTQLLLALRRRQRLGAGSQEEGGCRVKALLHRCFGPIWRETQILWYRWAVHNMGATHPDIGIPMSRLCALYDERVRDSLPVIGAR